MANPEAIDHQFANNYDRFQRSYNVTSLPHETIDVTLEKFNYTTDIINNILDILENENTSPRIKNQTLNLLKVFSKYRVGAYYKLFNSGLYSYQREPMDPTINITDDRINSWTIDDSAIIRSELPMREFVQNPHAHVGGRRRKKIVTRARKMKTKRTRRTRRN
jgi:hypothetical protein